MFFEGVHAKIRSFGSRFHVILGWENPEVVSSWAFVAIGYLVEVEIQVRFEVIHLCSIDFYVNRLIVC